MPEIDSIYEILEKIEKKSMQSEKVANGILKILEHINQIEKLMEEEKNV